MEKLRSRLGWPVLLMVLAFAFIGTRAISDPDEGRYTNVALNMLDSGDWMHPQRQHEVGHWTKPPLTYWAIAASVGALGTSAWAARLPAALSYLASIWLVTVAARWLLPGAGRLPGLVYATALLPLAASQIITTDYLLSAFTTAAMAAFVQARFGVPAAARRWLVVAWACLGLAFLTKGPPGLLPLLVMTAFDRLCGRPRQTALFRWTGLLAFAAIGLPWYLASVSHHQGLLGYLLGSEVLERVATDRFNRNGQWYGWLTVYGPVLLAGSLPWTLDWLGWWRALPASLRRWRDRSAREREAPRVLLALWLLLPLLVFCVSRSRLPLYVLPLLAPIALMVAAQRIDAGREAPRTGWLLGWIVLMLGLRVAWAQVPTHRDAGAWAEQIRARVAGPVHEVVFVEDMARYGLRLELGAQVEKLALRPLEGQPRFNPPFDEDVARELGQFHGEGTVVWVCKQALWPQVQAVLAGQHYAARPLGGPFHGRVLFLVEPVPASPQPAPSAR